MKKKIYKIFSLVMTAALFMHAVPVIASTTDTPVDIDKNIYDQMLKNKILYDTNLDGIISEEEFKNARSLRISLDDVNDISFLKKAENLTDIQISGGSITDFELLCSLKKLKSITIKNNPVKDVSYFKDMNLIYLCLDDTNVTVEDRISMIKTTDLEIPVGFADDFNIKPDGLLDTELVIANNEIAGFGEDGDARINTALTNDIVAKKTGKTTYSVMYEGNEIAKGNIKVTPYEVKDPKSDVSGIKVDKIEQLRRESDADILTEDDKYYNYKDGKFVLVADDVKTAYKSSLFLDDMGKSQFVLKNDGSFTIDGKSVFDDNTKVSQINVNYALTEDGSLWVITSNGNLIEKTKICTECKKIEDNMLVTKKDGTVIYVFCDMDDGKFTKSYIYEIGKINIVSVYDNFIRYLLDDKGNVWKIDIGNITSEPEVKLVAKNAVKIGKVVLSGLSSPIVYAGTDGKVYSCNDGKEFTEVTADDIVENNYDSNTNPNALYNKKRNYFFYVEPTVTGGVLYGNDILCGRSVSYRDKSLYMSCWGRYIAVSDVKESWGAYYDKDANDYSILIVRNDNTLWEYRIGADTLTQVTTDSVKSEEPKVTEPPVTTTKAPETTTNSTTTQPEEKLSVSDVISLIRYMTGASTLTDSQVKKYDMNSDGKINVVDIILLKNIIIGEKNK